MKKTRMSKVITGTILGLDAEIVTVETDLAVGLPAFNLVGLPGSAVRESKDRVRSAIINSGLEFPLRRITVNLSPADARKEGSHFDLPIAVGIITSAAEKIDNEMFSKTAFFGELSLDGTISRMDIAIAMVLSLQAKGITEMFIPKDNIYDLFNLPGVTYYPVEHLRDVISHLLGERKIDGIIGNRKEGCLGDVKDSNFEDFFDVKGQENIKRALLISVAGFHDILLEGSPGVGKSMLAKRAVGIMPPMTEIERREATIIHNIAGEIKTGDGLLATRPFRSPHHSATNGSIIGGGHRANPGELSLAHRGILFLDELPEFDRRTIDMLRQPLEDRYINLSRVGIKQKYPCNFLLIAAMNPCPCGYYLDDRHECKCTETQRLRYIAKVSGPFIDRIDIYVKMNNVAYEEFESHSNNKKECMTSAEMKEKITRVWKMQAQRNSAENMLFNGQLSGKILDDVCKMTDDAKQLLKQAYEQYALSARARSKIIKVARTIADLDTSETIKINHIAEAIAYRVDVRGNK